MSTSTTSRIDFGANRLEGDRLTSGGKGWIVTGATAEMSYGPSEKGPDVGRAILGLIGGAILGVLFGFLIIGGIIAVAAFAVVLGIVSGLKPVEHGKAYITVDLADGARVVIDGPLDKWQDAQAMTDAINTRRAAE